jgi:hypothetical protein
MGLHGLLQGYLYLLPYFILRNYSFLQNLEPLLVKPGGTRVDNNLFDNSAKVSRFEPVRLHSFCLFQLSDDGVADYDTIIGMLPDVIADRGGKMIGQCRHVSEYSAHFVYRVKSDILRAIYPVRKIKNILHLLEYFRLLGL